MDRKVSDKTNQMAITCTLIDPHVVNNHFNATSTFARGRERIDYISLGLRIKQCITYAHMAPFQEGIISYLMVLVIFLGIRKLPRGNVISCKRKERETSPKIAKERRRLVEEVTRKGKQLKWEERSKDEKDKDRGHKKVNEQPGQRNNRCTPQGGQKRKAAAQYSPATPSTLETSKDCHQDTQVSYQNAESYSKDAWD